MEQKLSLIPDERRVAASCKNTDNAQAGIVTQIGFETISHKFPLSLSNQFRKIKHVVATVRIGRNVETHNIPLDFGARFGHDC